MKAAPGRRCNWVSTLETGAQTWRPSSVSVTSTGCRIPVSTLETGAQTWRHTFSRGRREASRRERTRTRPHPDLASVARALERGRRVTGPLAGPASEDKDTLVGDRPAAPDDVEPAVEVARHGAQIADEHGVDLRVNDLR